ncbi:MAG: CAAX prenyl protease-related protein [Burkholderiales bacterium]
MPSFLSQPAAARVVPFALFIAFLALNSLLGDASGIDTRWLYPVRTIVVGLALLIFWKRYDELRGTFRMPGGLWALAIVVGLAVFALWVNLDARWMLMGEPGKGYDPRDGGQINLVLALFRVLGASVVVPIMEELFWRSFVMRWIDNPRFLDVEATAATWKAVLISSAVFGVEHNEWFAGIVAGLAYAWLYRLTGNLRVPIVSHAVTNGLLGLWVLTTGAWHYW